MNLNFSQLLVFNPIANTGLLITIILLILSILTIKKENQDPQRYIFLSLRQTNQIRGISILIIIVHHFFSYLALSLGENSSIQILNITIPPRYIVFNLGQLGVISFLILSGFGLYQSIEYKGLNIFLEKRFFKIFIPLFWTSAIYIVIDVIFNQSLNPSFLLDLIKASNYWFLGFIFLWYLILYLTCKVSLSNQNRFILLCVFAFILSVIPQIDLNWKVSALAFPFGYWIGLNHQKYSRLLESFRNKKFLPLLLGLLWFFAILTYRLANLAYQSGLIFHLVMLACLTLVGLIFYLFKNNLEQVNYAQFFSLIGMLTIVALNYFSWTFTSNILPADQNLAGNILRQFSLISATLAIFLIVFFCHQKLKVFSRFLEWSGTLSLELYLIHYLFYWLALDYITLSDFTKNYVLGFCIFLIISFLGSIILKKVSSLGLNYLK